MDLTTPITQPIEQPFYLMLALDQTGSIGDGGAIRGIEIIDLYGPLVLGIGIVSFGAGICADTGILSPSEARNFLINRDNNGFFCDNGGGGPENGVDGLNRCLDVLQTLPNDALKLMFLKTDEEGWGRNDSNPVTVNSRLNTEISATWLEFETPHINGSSYAEAFPETSKVSHTTLKVPGE